MKEFRALLLERMLCQDCFVKVKFPEDRRCNKCKRKRADYQQRVRDAVKAEREYELSINSNQTN